MGLTALSHGQRAGSQLHAAPPRGAAARSGHETLPPRTALRTVGPAAALAGFRFRVLSPASQSPAGERTIRVLASYRLTDDAAVGAGCETIHTMPIRGPSSPTRTLKVWVALSNRLWALSASPALQVTVKSPVSVGVPESVRVAASNARPAGRSSTS